MDIYELGSGQSLLQGEKVEYPHALALDPNYAWAHHVLGRWHREMIELGRIARLWVNLFYGGLPPASLDQALTHLDRAVALEPKELAHHVERGDADRLVDVQEAAHRTSPEPAGSAPPAEAPRTVSTAPGATQLQALSGIR